MCDTATDYSEADGEIILGNNSFYLILVYPYFAHKKAMGLKIVEEGTNAVLAIQELSSSSDPGISLMKSVAVSTGGAYKIYCKYYAPDTNLSPIAVRVLKII